MKILPYAILIFLLACQTEKENPPSAKSDSNKIEKVEVKDYTKTGVGLVVLGNVQDAGSPQVGCYKECCKSLQENLDPTRMVVSMGLIDYDNHKKYIFEASPDFVSQWADLNEFAGFDTNKVDGIFLTHAHIGHYTGLMFLGMESMNGDHVPVYSMPKMSQFLSENGPWSQLVKFGNVDLKPIGSDMKTIISSNIVVEPFVVPHRDEFSETVGFRIFGPNKSVLFIPDINKWSIWKTSIVDEIKKVDYAFLDGSFYDGNELLNRNMGDIPPPFIVESMELFNSLSEEEKSKVHFIHFNHTNPLLRKGSKEYQQVINKGYDIAEFHEYFEL